MWVIACGLTALAAVSLVSILRALLPTRIAAKKPWSCDICIGFWMTLALCLVWTAVATIRDRVIGLDRLLLVSNGLARLFLVFPTHGLVLIILSRIRPPSFEFLKETPNE